MSVAERQQPSPGRLTLDHLAHFVPDLGAAARALTALGFAVTPESAHRNQDGPAGSSNVCVMLERGYLEILAPTADTPNGRNIRAFMQRYSGIHLCCFGTPDAEGEQRRLEAHGFAPPEMVQLSRHTEGMLAKFSVVRAGAEKMPEGRVQYVQHFTPEAIWRPQHLRHANDVSGLACVFVVADHPVAVAARWAHFAAVLPRRAGAYVHLPLERGHVLIGRRASWAALLGEAPPAPGFAGYALECRATAALVSRCELAGLALRRLRDNLYVASLPEALGGSLMFGTRKGLGLPT